jgi:T-complex protein 1 subunit eta
VLGAAQQPQIILLKEGTDTSQGTPQLISNINACMAVTDAIRTTLGPRGMDKLVIDDRVSALLARLSLIKACSCLHWAGQHFLTMCLLVSLSGLHQHSASVQGQVTISNDGATIMKKLEIVHPAAKVLVDISLSQDAEVRRPSFPATGSPPACSRPAGTARSPSTWKPKAPEALCALHCL